MARLEVVLCLTMLTAPSVGHSQYAPSWVGQKVALKYPTALKTDAGVIVDNSPFGIYQVDRVDGDWLRLVYRNKAGWVAARDVLSVDQAIDFYTKEIALKPTSIAYRMRGNIWHDRQDYKRALADYSQAIRLNPQDAVAFQARGAVLGAENEYDKAFSDFNEAIRLDPNFSLAFNCRGQVWLLKNDLDRAISDLNKAISLDSKDPNALSNRGCMWVRKGDFEKAMADFNAAVKLDPKCAMTFANRGMARLQRNDHVGAFADFNEAIRLDPKCAMAFNNRGMACLLRNDHDKALADLKEAIRLDPKLSLAFNNRGVAWTKKRDFDKAIADFNEAIRLNPRYVTPYCCLARIWVGCNDPKYHGGIKAVELATRACELSQWKDAECLEALARIYNESGDFDKAVKIQEKALVLLPEGEARKSGDLWLTHYKYQKLFKDKG